METFSNTQQLITEALIELLRKKKIEEISITDIVKKAGLSRQTFYRHFNSKEDILTLYINHLREECFFYILKGDSSTIHGYLKDYFSFWLSHRDVLKTIDNNSLYYDDNAMYLKFVDKLMNVTELSKLKTFEDYEKEYIKSFVLSGLLSMKYRWIRRDFKESPEELTELVFQTLKLG